MINVTRYPLAWPAGWRRTVPHRKRPAPFGKTVANGTYRGRADLTIADGIGRLLEELRRLGAVPGSVVISTNVPTRNDGLPYSNSREPDDTGVAVYFQLKGSDRVLACDAFTKVAGNLAAVAAHVEAIRAVERYGVGSLEQAFAGYTALPPEPSVDWWAVLSLPRDASLEAIEAAWRRLALAAHPDRPGGSHDAMARINAARDAAIKAVRADRRARGVA